jgi:uncharacterized membrane protein (DUF485 family)
MRCRALAPLRIPLPPLTFTVSGNLSAWSKPLNSNLAPPTPAASGVSRNAKLGLILFFIYCVAYIGFIVFSAYGKDVMAKPALGGVNVAIVYGFGLIIGAFVLAVIYVMACVAETPAVSSDVANLTEGQLAEEAQKEEGAA